jgi:hypothetical protein
MLHVRRAETLQSSRLDVLGKPNEPRLDISRKNGDLRRDGFIEDFNLPRRCSAYLIFEIGATSLGSRHKRLSRFFCH